MKERPQVERDSCPPLHFFRNVVIRLRSPRRERKQSRLVGFVSSLEESVQVCGLGAQGWRERGQCTVGRSSQRWV